jgi:hypothetical protein
LAQNFELNMKTWIWIWILEPATQFYTCQHLSVPAHFTLSLPGAGAERKAARAGRRERVQLRPSRRLRLRAAFPDPPQAQGDEEGGGAHLQLCLPQEGGAGPNRIYKK